MAKICDKCGTENKIVPPVPYVAHQSAMARAERTQKRLIWIIVLLIVLFVGSNFAWIVYENSFEDYVITQDVEQDADNGANEFVGGDYYGKAEDKNNN